MFPEEFLDVTGPMPVYHIRKYLLIFVDKDGCLAYQQHSPLPSPVLWTPEVLQLLNASKNSPTTNPFPPLSTHCKRVDLQTQMIDVAQSTRTFFSTWISNFQFKVNDNNVQEFEIYTVFFSSQLSITGPIKNNNSFHRRIITYARS